MNESQQTICQVLVVDDTVAVRTGLTTMLSLTGSIDVIGEASNGLEAVCQVRLLHPDVVLMDLEMPALDGYEATRQIKAAFPSCRVVALTIHDYDSARQRASRAGVDAFVVKGAPLETLLAAIDASSPDQKSFLP